MRRHLPETNEYEALHVDRIADHTRAFIKVQDGCNQFCSYCIIPYARGRVQQPQSRKRWWKRSEALARSGLQGNGAHRHPFKLLRTGL